MNYPAQPPFHSGARMQRDPMPLTHASFMSFMLIRVISKKAVLLVFVTLMAACGSPLEPSPGEYKLTGTVQLQTPDGLVAAAGVTVQETSLRRSVTTDSRGRYSFYGLAAGVAHVRISYYIFDLIDRDVTIASDTVADFQLTTSRRLVMLSGRITEMTSTGPVAVSGVKVEADFCPPLPNGSHQLKDALTDADGNYRIDGLCEGTVVVFVTKAGYENTSPNTPFCDDGHGTECRWVTIAGDTRFDQVLARK
jgi:hypothetical protein